MGKQTKKATSVSTGVQKESLAGKILAICICVMPFVTRLISLTISDSVKNAYFLSSYFVTDFEQYCREIFLLLLAVVMLVWFVWERIFVQPRKKMPFTRISLAMLLCLAGYLLLGLLSAITSSEQSVVWLGNYQLYEGYFALVGYAIVFGAAWYWVDSEEVVRFVQNCLTDLAIILGLFVIFEEFGYCYYNNGLVQLLGGYSGTVSFETATLTFGNSDYLGQYCAMLLPTITAMIFSTVQKKREKFWKIRLVLQILAAVLVAVALILTEVLNAILIGFGVTALFLLICLLRSGSKRVVKIAVSCTAGVAVLVSGFSFVNTRTGDTFAEKLHYTMVGMEGEETFQLLEASISEDTITLENAETVFCVTAQGETLSVETLTFSCNGAEVTPLESGSVLKFQEEELTHCQITVEDNSLSFQLGYATPLEFNRKGDSWQAVGIGGTLLDEIPQVSDSTWLQQHYTYLNGRVFAWANTISVLKDCLLFGHGPATTLFYLNQNDLPALLNIFGTYALYNKPHSWYLQMAQDTGVLSALLVIALLVVFLVYGWRKCIGKKTTWNPWRTGLWLSVFAYCCTAALSDSLIYHAPMFWFLLGVGLREMTREEVA